MQFLDLNILQRPLLDTFDAASILTVLYLLVRRGRQWFRIAGLAAAGGVAAGAITLYICEGWLNVFGLPLDTDTRVWAVAAYGLDATLGALLGLNTTSHLALPTLDPKPAPLQPLWKTWKAPAGMPVSGRSGSVTIPATASGFHARDAHLYLPPAALVPDPPELPVLIMMMGQPGGPEQDKSSVRELDALARQNHGLAPITLTIDQLGNPFQNPACVDSDLGKVYTYVTKDVVNYIHRNLNVDRRRTEWAVGGYSNGGECALSFGAKGPDLFGSILDISGELKPLNGTEANTVSVIFKGNHAAFAAEEPANIMKARRYPDELAIFTSGSRDLVYGPQATVAAQDAKAAGMRTRSFVGSGVGHRGDALDFGVRTGLPLLCPRFGLTAP